MTDYPMTWEEAVAWLRDQPDRQDLVRACFYDDPLPDAAERYLRSTEWRAVRAELPKPGGCALDLAAGRGVASYALARDGWQVVALEPDLSRLVGCGAIRALVAATGVSIEIVEEWGEELPFEDARFDVAHCRQALHHARDLAAMLGEIGRVLKPGGIFIATREHVISRRADLPQFFDAHPLHHLYGGENAYLLKEYVDAIHAADIEIMKVLNPFASDINLFPRTRAEMKAVLARRFLFPFPSLLPDRLLSWYGARSDAPGRPFTFVGRKPIR